MIQNGIQVETEGLGGTVYTDEKWAVFILGQLLQNAARYRGEAPVITISAFACGSMVHQKRRPLYRDPIDLPYSFVRFSFAGKVSVTAVPSPSREEMAKFRRERLGFVFQDFNLLDTLTIEENIGLALSLNHQDPIFQCFVLAAYRLPPLLAALWYTKSEGRCIEVILIYLTVL